MSARTINLVGAMATAVSDRIESAAAERSGHSGAGAAVLSSLKAEPGLSVGALARIVTISESGAVRLLDRFASDGLVERRAGSDGRTSALFLTAAGEEVAKEVQRERRERVKAALAPLSASERQALESIAEKVLAGLTDGEVTGSVICRLCDLDACPQDRCPVEMAIV